MKRPRLATVISLAYFAGLVVIAPHITLRTFNLLLTMSVVPMVWLLWRFGQLAINLHARREEKAIEKVLGQRPQPIREGARR